jgi:hypothetical protein
VLRWLDEGRTGQRLVLVRVAVVAEPQAQELLVDVLGLHARRKALGERALHLRADTAGFDSAALPTRSEGARSGSLCQSYCQVRRAAEGVGAVPDLAFQKCRI